MSSVISMMFIGGEYCKRKKVRSGVRYVCTSVCVLFIGGVVGMLELAEWQVASGKWQC